MTDTTDPQPLRIPIGRNVTYAVRGMPKVANQYGPGFLLPTEVSLTYRATEDSQLGRFHAYVKGHWLRDGEQVPSGEKLPGQHYYGDPASWPDWLAAEARLHDPDAAEPPRRQCARTLTESEYNAAWHAVEGAAGEEGADPGTVLHAVLDRLGITVPGAVEQPAVAESETCGKCKRPFDPADTAFDGRARYHLTPYCRGCVDRCHDNEIADHRCVICA
ncbi:hypothetical protein ACH40F_08105 [Streptomyces sp. NPDC020794]|uniref:hypothetical protein n=1 Tax=unclassified Streptomyces TaxID=2593676 RepID=UPI0036E035DF